MRVAHSQNQHVHGLPYDHLVIAIGCTTNFFHLPGLEETAFTMKSLGDAIRVRNHLIENPEPPISNAPRQGASHRLEIVW